ncbi:hypothetical protein ElyMa_005878600 [Elysia marginata]|uniref:Uncharacterized protein n=1 Tax=Elysia marginata TaxID=1093978 RepID=A0AAV4G3H5_9GAST|nr:hypothetical protein ElyMa_005878600 [Elysia marginata]
MAGQAQVIKHHRGQFIRLAHLCNRFPTATSTSLQIQGRRSLVSPHTVRCSLVGCLNFNVPVNFEVVSETALGAIKSVLPHCDVKSDCIHHTQPHYPDTGPTRLNTKSIMPDTRRISC